MNKKLAVFLFGLSAMGAFGIANAFPDPCVNTCMIKLEDCKSKPWLTLGYCQWRFETCLAACEVN